MTGAGPWAPDALQRAAGGHGARAGKILETVVALIVAGPGGPAADPR
ncbi:MAG TPA: hypothetical protein VE287_01470 [Actinopolymorphaceae bacterium]|nr:hypothetical protein [Actinopolymorphaceae bacterium]